jgi:hypothetical protein
MLNSSYNPESTLKHLDYMNALLTDPEHITYKYFFSTLFETDNDLQILIATDIMSRRLSYFKVELPITEFDKYLLTYSITELKDQINLWSPLLKEK